MKFFIASKNKHKIAEFVRILEPMNIEVISEADLVAPLTEVEETGKTFEENAIIKAKSGLKHTGLMSVADDSGLCVDYLDGAPGVFSARFSGLHGDDDSNNRKLLELLDGVPYEKRTAKYVAAIACIFPDGREFTVRGECHGHISDTPAGDNGFGYDPYFISELGCFGVISAEEKDSISHRGKALKLFVEELKKYL